MISFREKVYQIIKKIPQGEVLTYKQVAKLVGRPRAWRAVGNVLNKNRNPKIPCHRVVKTNWEVGGYNRGISQKIRLLRKEGLIIKIKEQK